MSIKSECQTAIYSYVSAETQSNAALTGEHKEYVLLVLILMRDLYKSQVADGATTFNIPEETAALLTSECPWL
jgi:hypothetical protein